VILVVLFCLNKCEKKALIKTEYGDEEDARECQSSARKQLAQSSETRNSKVGSKSRLNKKSSLFLLNYSANVCTCAPSRPDKPMPTLATRIIDTSLPPSPTVPRNKQTKSTFKTNFSSLSNLPRPRSRRGAA
jgi:hypothetical protein